MHDQQVADRIRERLNLICEWRGSAAQLSKDTGINRTQIGRFLSGQSIPRADILSIIADACELPISWFFDKSPEQPQTLSEHEIASSYYKIFQGRHFQVDDRDIPAGMAIFWKGKFTKPGYYEAILSQIKHQQSVCTVKSSMIAALKDENLFEHSDPIDHFCHGLILKSGPGYTLSFSDTRQNIVVTGYMERKIVTWSSATFYFGYLVIHANVVSSVGRLSRSVAPVIFEILPQNTKSAIAAARRRGLYLKEELPAYIQSFLDEYEVPDVALMPR